MSFFFLFIPSCSRLLHISFLSFALHLFGLFCISDREQLLSNHQAPRLASFSWDTPAIKFGGSVNLGAVACRKPQVLCGSVTWAAQDGSRRLFCFLEGLLLWALPSGLPFWLICSKLRLKGMCKEAETLSQNTGLPLLAAFLAFSRSETPLNWMHLHHIPFTSVQFEFQVRFLNRF